MHPYATNSEERKRVPLYLAFLSIIASLSLGYLLYLKLDPIWAILLPPPSAIGCYDLFLKLFDKYFWKLQFLRKLGLVRVPYLHGPWIGHVTSSYDPNKQKNVAVKIEQTWSNMLIELESDDSKSETLMAAIYLKSANTTELLYEYHSEPRDLAVKSMHPHDGSAKLKFSRTVSQGSAKLVLRGSYFTGRGRERHGEIYLEKDELSSNTAR